MRTPRLKVAVTAVAAALLLGAAVAASAYPEGAPWGAANPAAEESCGDCHYDYEPVENSPALAAEGLPEQVAAGDRYDFVLRFAEAEAKISGFQVTAGGDGSDAGRFTSSEENLESLGNAIRSTATRRVDGEVQWAMTWHAPSAIAGEKSRVTFYLAASAANDDQSPFGDVIHYRQIEVEVAPGGASDP